MGSLERRASLCSCYAALMRLRKTYDQGLFRYDDPGRGNMSI